MNNETGKDFVIAVFFVPISCVLFSRNVSVFTSCVAFDYVISDKNEKDLLIRDFNVPTNCLLLSRPNNHETSTGFYKWFVLASCNQSLNYLKPYSQNISRHL